MSERKEAQVTLPPPNSLSLIKTSEASWVSQWPTVPRLVEFKKNQILVPGITSLNEEICHFDLIIEDGELWLNARKDISIFVNGEAVITGRLYVGDTIEVADQCWTVEGGELWCRLPHIESSSSTTLVNVSKDFYAEADEQFNNRSEYLNHHELAEELENFRQRLNRWLSWQTLSSPSHKKIESTNKDVLSRKIEINSPVPIPTSISLKASTLAQLVEEAHQLGHTDTAVESIDTIILLNSKKSLLRSEPLSHRLLYWLQNKQVMFALKTITACFFAMLTTWFLFDLS